MTWGRTNQMCTLYKIYYQIRIKTFFQGGPNINTDKNKQKTKQERTKETIHDITT